MPVTHLTQLPWQPKLPLGISKMPHVGGYLPHREPVSWEVKEQQNEKRCDLDILRRWEVNWNFEEGVIWIDCLLKGCCGNRVENWWRRGDKNGRLENPMNSMKRQYDRIPKEEPPRSLGAQYATGDQRRNNYRKNEGMEPKQKKILSCGCDWW